MTDLPTGRSLLDKEDLKIDLASIRDEYEMK